MFTDKTDELQRLLDAGQGRIVLPDGHYLITRPLLISDHTTLVCSPRTHLELADGANCPIIKNREKGTTMTRGITLEGGTWDGNNLNQGRSQTSDENVKNFSESLKEALFYPPLMCFTYVEDFTLRGVARFKSCVKRYCVPLTGVLERAARVRGRSACKRGGTAGAATGLRPAPGRCC